MAETKRFYQPVACNETLKVEGAATIDGVLTANLLPVVTLSAAGDLTAAQSGSVVVITGATGYATNLPALAAGLHFRVYLGTSPTSGNHTIVTASAANNMIGTVHSSTGGNADSEASGGDTFNFVANAAIKGDRADFFCDGLNWYVTAFSDADAGITITTAA